VASGSSAIGRRSRARIRQSMGRTFTLMGVTALEGAAVALRRLFG
jgi:hypothetical protein